MFDFFKFFKGTEKESREVARDRLKLVLVHDRSNCSPEFLEMVKEDIMKVLLSYMDVDEEHLDIKITKTMDDQTGKPALIANIPIKNMKRR
ncbi:MULTISPECIES: cell division topological specificity factor MinE [unclassified Fusibacter]|uniref:cell division topological specificity factor MinE n=1 Tax=unclassified Fusibacter TaxID=2624464 RepID=UPI0010112A1A|nr:MULTISPECIES: cell division topological specificity factor MinE [unclassified Fusibacter]MCK8060674.1 cell division topological specificity factor MinE [Fusibacter sp. A2]NPE22872.1 cell division topological specificity factor MinE [Fusibacter sp. A1]RXV59941.1 cell division topological specificity factor MinE [Fusibacter sp. A1]